jgi:integrase
MRFLAPTSWNSAIFAQLASSSPVTLNTEITVIRAFLYWCKEFKGLKENPAAKIKPRQVIQKAPMVYADEDVKQMLQKANAVEKALILTLCYTGLREQEICHLTWSDVDPKKKLLRVSAKPEYGFTPKTWEDREIEMSDRLIEAFKNLPRKQPWFFPTVRGERHAHVYKIVERVAKNAGVIYGLLSFLCFVFTVDLLCKLSPKFRRWREK